MSCLGIIPARGGSKGIPRKNLANVGGKPLIQWTWEAARQARGIDRLIVSTDDHEIASKARAANIEVPFMRDPEYATDSASAVDVILHTLTWFERHAALTPSTILWLQPTSPLRGTQDIEAAIDLQLANNADAVVGVCLAEHPPFWTRRLSSEGILQPLSETTQVSRRQDLPQLFRPNGAIYVIKREALVREHTMYPARTYGFVMPPERSIDIDTPWDLYLADLVLTHGSTVR